MKTSRVVSAYLTLIVTVSSTTLSAQTTADDFLKSAVEKYERKDFDGSVADCSRAIALDPKSVEAYYGRGNARQGNGDLTGAIADFSKVVELDPLHHRAYFNRGCALQRTGDLKRAHADFSKVIELNREDSYTAYVNRSQVRLESGETDGALQDAGKAIKLKPDHAPAWINRGSARAKKGEFVAAITDFTKAIQLTSTRRCSCKPACRRPAPDLRPSSPLSLEI